MPPNKPLTKKKVFFLITILFLGLTGLRISWFLYHKTPDHPHAEKGLIDVRDWKFSNKQLITLNGEWEFYPNQFIEPLSIDKNEQRQKVQYISVPGNWVNEISENKKKSAIGYGTYRLKVILPKNESIYGLRIENINTAAKVYANGKLLSTFGNPATSAYLAKGKRGPFSTQFFHDKEREVELIIHVSNYDLASKGGIIGEVKFGTQTAIMKKSQQSLTLQTTVFIIYLLHSLYAFSLYFMNKKENQKDLFFYGLMLVIAGFVVLIDDDIVLHLPISVEWYHKLLNLLFISTLITLTTSIKYLFQIKSRIFQLQVLVYCFLSFALFITPYDYFMFLNFGMMILYLLSFYFLFSNTINVIQENQGEGIYVLFFITGYTSNMFWGGLINSGLVNIPFYPFDFIIYVVAIALLLLNRHIQMIKINKEQTKALQEAEKKKDEFLTNTAHELRNPLHGIINISQTMLNEYEETLTQKNKENLYLLIQIAQHMRFTLNDILDLTHIQNKHLRLHRESINLHTVTSIVFDMMQFMKERKQLQFQMNIPHSFPNVYADENRLVQILFNLIHNAIKYTPKGSITVEARQKNGIATISVRDTGIGIHEDVQQKIFQPYEQEDASITSIGGGIGLGLHVCKQLVELHGGTISVESKRGFGSTFSFTLPLAVEIKENAKQAEETFLILNQQSHQELEIHSEPTFNNDDKKANILVVDDDPINLKIIKNMLESDYSIMTATSGNEALDLIDSYGYDLIISDIMMPHMSGYEFTQRVRERYTLFELPILLLTARHQAEDIYTGFLSGANDYVSKPVDAIELKARVNSLIHLKLSVQEQLRMETAWLQAQIRPHFLFNTLNTIASLSEIDTKRMTALLEHFGNYLRRSFDVRNTETVIPLEEELALVRSYLFIEKERFGERLQVTWDIDNDLNINVPPLSIQTLVENAVHHGVLKRATGGYVLIQITNIHDNNKVRISIKDNGVGMEQTEADKLLSTKAHSTGKIGIANTNERLKRLYGKGLTIHTSPNNGTVVNFIVWNMAKLKSARTFE